MRANNPLIDLLAGLFRSGELVRFLEHVGLRRSSVTSSWDKLGIYELAELAVEELTEQQFINAAFFDNLLEQRPEREDDIRYVQQQLLGSEGGESEPEGGRRATQETDESSLGDERRAFRTRLRSRMRQRDEQADAARPWVEAAAVLDGFDPSRLRPLRDSVSSTHLGASEGEALQSLAPHVAERPDGHWVLLDRSRREALKRLIDEERVSGAFGANPELLGPRSVLLRSLLDGEAPELEELGLEQLLDLEEVVSWVEGLRSIPVQVERLDGFVERRRTMAPLQRLVRNFRGRRTEKKRLRDHLRGEKSGYMVLWGAGGIGKSALLGNLLLEMEQADLPTPWVYLNFDDPSLDPRRPELLVEVMARQLGLLYATHGDASNAFLGVESVSAGDQLSFTLPVAGTVRDLASALADGLRQLPLDGTPPFLLVLDTFEHVQVQGRSAVDKVRELTDTIASCFPRTRVLVSGRAEVPEWDDAEMLVLKALEPESADAVLEALGIPDPSLRGEIIEKMGCSPLTLQFAAEAYRRAGGYASVFAEVSAREGLIAEARDIEVQQQLYTRILSALSPQIAKLAHPGLIVRRVTPEIIAEVLAEPCELDPADADELFAELARRVDLFEETEGGAALRHRQDVRELMLRSMIHEDLWREKFEMIHAAAIHYYSVRTDIISQAESLYHKLMSGEPPTALDALWSDELRNLLSTAWNEPLSDSARSWLGPRIGQRFDPNAVRPVDWEISAAREAQQQLDSGDAAGALAKVRERDDRSPGSSLYRLEAEALLRTGNVEAARLAVDHAIGMLADDYDEWQRLLILRARVFTRLGDLAEVEDTTERAIEVARLRDDQGAELEALAFHHVAIQELAPDQSELAVEALTRSFLSADEEVIYEKAPLSTRIMKQVGAESAPVLRKGALILGRNVSEGGTFQGDAFKLGRLFESVDDEDEFAALARQVGLPSKGYDMRELAGQAVRFGRMGEALATILDSAGHQQEVRDAVVDMIRPESETKI